ncbi:MAG TPA: hypothetical protein VF257_09120 [Solirubrobacteraceae bacterium]
MASQVATHWTYETLAAADRPTLEQVLLSSPPPDYEQLEGYIYCGWNHEPVGKLSGEKFKKGFRRRDGRPFGYNEIVRQDRQGYRGEWNVRLWRGRPIQVGYFRVSLVKEEPPQPLYRPYLHAGHFNYNVDLNKWHNLPFRVIRDFVVLPNPGDHGLMLCKAYLQFGFHWANVFYCYFLLGHRQEIEYEPW